jgi:hypothetical protein
MPGNDAGIEGVESEVIRGHLTPARPVVERLRRPTVRAGRSSRVVPSTVRGIRRLLRIVGVREDDCRRNKRSGSGQQCGCKNDNEHDIKLECSRDVYAKKIRYATRSIVTADMRQLPAFIHQDVQRPKWIVIYRITSSQTPGHKMTTSIRTDGDATGQEPESWHVT